MMIMMMTTTTQAWPRFSLLGCTLFTSKVDDFLSYRLNMQATLSRPIKIFQKWFFALPCGGALSLTYPSKLIPKIIQFSPGYASDEDDDDKDDESPVQSQSSFAALL